MIDNPLGGRQVEEWIGKTADSAVPDRVKDRVFMRFQGRCHRTGLKIQAGDKWELEHLKALGLGGENRERNLAPILAGDPHKEKTAEEVGMMRKADRMRRKHNGTWPKSKAKLQGRGFAKTRDI
ncbi:HNH endonuclease [Roseibium sp. RKSG952]|uniref:HNH endonuclease n=1 Tax=Roseibium sp. RKSG952 TaxID=2529384 RepID=UPI0034CF45E5